MNKIIERNRINMKLNNRLKSKRRVTGSWAPYRCCSSPSCSSRSWSSRRAAGVSGPWKWCRSLSDSCQKLLTDNCSPPLLLFSLTPLQFALHSTTVNTKILYVCFHFILFAFCMLQYSLHQLHWTKSLGKLWWKTRFRRIICM